ncbi:S28 family serine protease [Ignavibacterium sp.]|uniref:S28 family serine protease n=2 Tax=Ignavibacterium sp. TaxID=2651167 RepID=UPI00307CE35D
MKSIHTFLLSVILLFVVISCSSGKEIQQSESKLYKWLLSQPDLTVKKLEPNEEFNEVYEIFIEQPIDQLNPNSPKFKQQFFLSHKDEDLPIVAELDGYSVGNRANELSRLLNCNQIIVEHRYFGESVPEPFDWKYLDIKQAAADHHRIIQKLKEFYKDKWITTGISKGGSTVIFHRRFYPNDVDATVAYVAPVNFSVDDNRVYEWFKTASTDECRQKVKNLQKYFLRNRDVYYPIFVEVAEKKKYEYNIVGFERAFEYCVLEYSFAYWQWNSGGCENIPDTTESEEIIFGHFKEHAGLDYFSDESIKSLYPFWYQCYTEYGYYAYDITEFKDLLKFADGKTFFFIPDSLQLDFNPEPMKDISNWVANKANNMIFIYGGNDPWTSTGVCLTGKTNSLKMILPNGSHRTRIKSFPPNERELIYKKLEDWLDIKIER